MKTKRLSWILMGSIACSIVVAGLVITVVRMSVSSRTPEPAPSSETSPDRDTESRNALDSASPSVRQPVSELPAHVLVWIETTPQGAAIVREADHFVLGWTPETIEFLRSNQPVAIRLEMTGYVTETRNVSVTQDGSLSVTLKASKDKRPNTVNTKPRQ